MASGPHIPPIVRAAELTQAGLSSGQAARVAAQQGLCRIRPGSYADAAEWEKLTPWAKHTILVGESSRHLTTGALISGTSAGALWGIPFLERLDDTVEVTAPRSGGGRHSRHFRYRVARELPAAAVINGVSVTTAARTAVDIARYRSFASGLMAFDHVLRLQLATSQEIEQALEDVRRMPGAARARLAYEFADPRAESPGESFSRARVLYIGAPLPELQFELWWNGRFLGRPDMWWPECETVGEFDGLGKYGIGPHALDTDGPSALLAEKAREDEIRRHVKNFLRWLWRELVEITPFENKLRGAGILTGPAVRLAQFH